VRESQVEAHLRKRIEAIGGLCYKFVSPGRRHVPDRIVLRPARYAMDGHMERIACSIFVELKAPGKKPTPGQLREHARLRELGFRVEVLDSTEAVDNFVEGL
jgi:hypothetical protein